MMATVDDGDDAPPCPPSPSLVAVARRRRSSPSRSSLSSLLMSPLVAVVSANAVSLAAAVALLSPQRSFAKMQCLYKNENTSVVTSETNEL